MPQTTVIPAWKAEVPILLPAQKPGGVTISTTLIANAVPNKPQPWTPSLIVSGMDASEGDGTGVQSMSAPVEVQPMMVRAAAPVPEEEVEEEIDEDEPPPSHPARRGRRR